MRPAAQVNAVRALAEAGSAASEIARRTGVPRTTVRDWLRGARAVRSGGPPLDAAEGSAFESEYAYLLGVYLGDGYVVRTGRTCQLRLALDGAYPGIVSAAAQAVSAIVPGNGVAVRPRPKSRCVDVTCYWLHWPRVLPQHGSGRKHGRAIALAPWQRRITHRHPQALLRGLIHSDGSRFVAVVRRRGRTYRYARYQFSNRSDDIKAIFSEHLDLLEIPWTRVGDHVIAVARRDGVSALDAFIGPKR